MAKRFTDTNKWRKPWFRALDLKAKLTWLYLTDNCDHAGLWDAAFDLISSDLGFTVTRSDLEHWFGEKLIVFEDKYFIPSFIEFQYGELKETSKPHLSVIKSLTSKGIDFKELYRFKQYPKGIGTLKEKEKDKDKEKEGESEGKQENPELKHLAKKVFTNLPILTKSELCQRYSPEFVERVVSDCIFYHSSDPTIHSWPTMKWGKIITSWCLTEKKKEEKNKDSKAQPWS